MREFKFRVWDVVAQRFLDPIDLVRRTTWGYGSSNNGQLIFGPSIIQQSTGLKDKNGVEIYEGDIIVTWAANRVGKRYPKRLTRRVVQWVNYARSTGFNIGTPTHIEVIGNIYENPELLEAVDG